MRDVQHRSAVSTDFVPYNKADIEQSIPDRFEQQVRAHPDRLAVSAESQAFTYRSLNDASNQIAHAILARCGEGEAPVALLLDQGVRLVAAILGVLKAGKLYVALDAADQKSQLNGSVVDSQPEIIVTEARHRALAAELAGSADRVLMADALPADVRRSNPGLALPPDRRAYIYYTSGSTGPAKGVVDTHRNVLHNVMRYTNNLSIGRNDRLSLIQSCSFSGTVSSLFCALLNGAAVFPFDLRRAGVEQMARWLVRERISIFHSVPVIFHQLMLARPKASRLRIIRLEGDQTFRRHVELYRRHFGHDCVLVNGLGTTETGLIRQYFITPETDIPGRGVPIGHQVEDMDICLLDESGAEVELGEVGEIVVRSRYLAIEYWRRPELTAAAFQADPENDDRRMYRSGDLGRMLPQGCLEYLGRKDLQAKVRGLRIAVADIENELRELAMIEQAAVVAREDSPGEQRLIAYLVSTADPPPTISELRRALSKSMPKFMIPARFVFLDDLPFDANFKVDRRALPAPGRDRPTLGQPFEGVVTEQERVVASCFRDVLAIDEIGVHDDFFELGGDSLAATKLLLLIEDRLHIHCLPETLIEAPSVSGIVMRLGQEIAVGGLVALQSEGKKPPLFCMHNYQGHLFDYLRLARLMGPEQPVYGIASYGSQGATHAQASIEEMAAAYVPKIRHVQSEGPYHLCGSCFGGVVAFEVAQQLRADGQDVALLALIDTAYPVGILRLRIRRLNLAYHWRNLTNSSGSEAVDYVRRRLWNIIRRTGDAACRGLTSLRKKSRPPLDSWPWIDAVQANRRAERRYKPAGYDGPISLICIGPPTNQLGWRRVVQRRLDIFQLTEKNRTSATPHLTDESYVHDLADTLSALLKL